jgi:hypothetical protein
VDFGAAPNLLFRRRVRIAVEDQRVAFIGALKRSNSTVVISFFLQGFRGGALQNTSRFHVHGLEVYDDL